MPKKNFPDFVPPMNAHPRRAYVNATRRFADWCASKEIHELTQVQPFHVAAFIHDLQEELSPPSVKQHLAIVLSNICTTTWKRLGLARRRQLSLPLRAPYNWPTHLQSPLPARRLPQYSPSCESG
jgi:hypothetical protein